jgi:uncharacterized phage-associated protein
MLTIMLEASDGKNAPKSKTRGVHREPGGYARAMASAHDVAKYILHKQEGSMSTWKLQKLVYYSQAWSLVWDGEPIFPERIEAWANGPVVPELYRKHRGLFSVEDWEWGNPADLSPDQLDTIDKVLSDYGDLTGRQLSHLTHAERPWRDAREGLGPTAPSSRAIPVAAMQAYYEALDADENAPAVGDIDWSALKES